MALRGRPRKPTNLKLLEGNPGRRPLPENEPKPRPVAPKRPAWLNSEAKRMWKRLAPELERLGLLTSVDGEAFAAACQAWGTYVECERLFKSKDPETGQRMGRTYTYVNKAGQANIIERPEVRIGQKALEAFHRFCSEFGLSPASRARIAVKAEAEGFDPMEELLRRPGG